MPIGLETAACTSQVTEPKVSPLFSSNKFSYSIWEEISSVREMMDYMVYILGPNDLRLRSQYRTKWLTWIPILHVPRLLCDQHGFALGPLVAIALGKTANTGRRELLLDHQYFHVGSVDKVASLWAFWEGVCFSHQADKFCMRFCFFFSASYNSCTERRREGKKKKRKKLKVWKVNSFHFFLKCIH